MSQAQVDADASLARSLAEQEASQARVYEAERRRDEWDRYATTRIYPYYYGSWRNHYVRPVVVYRDDPCNSWWFAGCFIFWLSVLFIALILVIYYT